MLQDHRLVLPIADAFPLHLCRQHLGSDPSGTRRTCQLLHLMIWLHSSLSAVLELLWSILCSSFLHLLLTLWSLPRLHRYAALDELVWTLLVSVYTCLASSVCLYHSLYKLCLVARPNWILEVLQWHCTYLLFPSALYWDGPKLCDSVRMSIALTWMDLCLCWSFLVCWWLCYLSVSLEFLSSSWTLFSLEDDNLLCTSLMSGGFSPPKTSTVLLLHSGPNQLLFWPVDSCCLIQYGLCILCASP